jgi:hypothetical protein
VISKREQALRRLPLPYSLALRLREAGVVDDVICLYVNVEAAALDSFYRIAEAKLAAVQEMPQTTAERISVFESNQRHGPRSARAEASLHRLSHRDVSFEAK